MSELTPKEKARQTKGRRLLVDGYDPSRTRAALKAQNDATLFVGKPIPIPRDDAMIAVLKALWAHYPEIRPGTDRLAKMTGKNRRTILRCLAALRQDKIITRIKRFNEHTGARLADQYEVDFRRLCFRQGSWSRSEHAVLEPDFSGDRPSDSSRDPSDSSGRDSGELSPPLRQFDRTKVANCHGGGDRQTLRSPSIRACASPIESQREDHVESPPMEVGLAGEERTPLERAVIQRALRVIFQLDPRTEIDHSSRQLFVSTHRVLSIAMATAGRRRIEDAIRWIDGEAAKAERGEREPIRSRPGLFLSVIEKYPELADVPPHPTPPTPTGPHDPGAELRREIESFRAELHGARPRAVPA